MLPTHVVRIEQGTSRADGAAPRVASGSSTKLPDMSNSMDSAVSNVMSTASYPPIVRRQETTNGDLHFRAVPGHAKSERIEGQRGIIAFTVQAQVPYDVGSEAANGDAPLPQPKQQVSQKGPAPRWHTWEYRFYAVVFITIVPLMIWVPIRLSQPSSPAYREYAHLLAPGWLNGRRRDDSDFQYKSFRDYVPVLVGVMGMYLLLGKATEALGHKEDYETLSKRIVRPHRRAFLLLFTAAFVFTLHGLNTFKLLAVLLINYALSDAFGGTMLGVPVTWVFNVGALFLVHYYEGLPFGALSKPLAWLDNYRGLLPRWQMNFNISMLRLVSYSLDHHWSRQTPQTAGEQQLDEAGPIAEVRQRASNPLRPGNYSLSNYLLYILYPPLFIAGPIMSFHDFIRQLHNPLPIPKAYTVKYAVRLAFSMLSMEIMLHYMYVNAIKDAKAWHGTTPFELSMIGFWNLIVVWLKLLIPWRFFRLWALADGVDPPENMIRCMANNYSTLGFWRSWHRSYNLWVVRYIYVPVGGAKNVIPATLLVFTFVALWHDLSLKLLTWGWLVTLFILPEIIARKLVPSRKYGETWWYRHVAAAGGVFNILLMMTANLVGFAIGTDGIKYMWQQLLSSWSGLSFMLCACAVLFVGVQVMFEYREEELRQGIDRKC